MDTVIASPTSPSIDLSRRPHHLWTTMKISKPHQPHSRFSVSQTAAPFLGCSGTSDPVDKKWSSHNNSLFSALLRSDDDAMLHLKIMSRGLQGFACQQLCTDRVRFLFSMRDVVMIASDCIRCPSECNRHGLRLETELGCLCTTSDDNLQATSYSQLKLPFSPEKHW
ncbi:hypothetical protein M405DRAFT_218180 [Rhizopogon salebrosus TDB-379]|nr:hypothetical protein M405DRAFT_218180 [Rhizopogon salebrosus TDB-379]